MGDNTETAVLAGGCAWIMQQLLRHPQESSRLEPDSWVARTTTRPRMTTAVMPKSSRVVFDPERLSYRGLLEVFFQVHRADLDEAVVGSIYRSEIFYTSAEQRRVAEEMIRDVDASGHWPGKTVTRISADGVFWEDGPEDQDYLLNGFRTSSEPRSLGRTRDPIEHSFPGWWRKCGSRLRAPFLGVSGRSARSCRDQLGHAEARSLDP